jgi:capsular exopolysaccharide synthesis family protein
MQLFQSRTIVSTALNSSGLIDLPSIVDNLKPRQNPSDFVIDNLAVSRGGSGQSRAAHVLNVKYRSVSDEDTLSVLTALIKSYQTFLTAKFQDVNQEAASLIAKAQTDLATELEEAEKNYERFRASSSNLMWRTGADTTNVHRVRYDLLLQEIANLQMQRAEAAARLDAVNERLNGQSPAELGDLERLSLVDEKNLTRVGLILMVQKGEIESADFQAEQPIRLAHAKAEVDGIGEMQMREKTLLTELGPQHPEVIGVRKQLETYQELLSKQKNEFKSGLSSGMSTNPSSLFDAYCKILKNDIAALDRREARLNELAEGTVKLASEMVADEIQGDALRRDVQRKKDLFDAAVDRLRDINLAKDYGGFINEVLAEPEVGQQVTPRLSTSLAIGGFVALALALAGIGLAEYRDRRFRTTDELQRALQLPVIGRIPMVARRRGKQNLVIGDGSSAPTGKRNQVLGEDSAAADAFRVLRTSLAFAEGEKFRQIIGVTSPCPGDGKSTTVSNLAISLGQLGRSVLIIDADLRRPSQHEMFALPNDVGLTAIISDGIDPAQAIQQTSHKNVSVLPRGVAITNPAEFLATGEFRRLLETLRDTYDHILIDCPPVLQIVETVVSASFADGVILVLKVEKTTQFEAQSACASLRQAGAELEGVVINAVRRGSLNDDSYNSIGYNYYYAAEYGYTEPKGKRSRETASSSSDRNASNGAESDSRSNGRDKNWDY